MIEARELSKRFGSVVALDRVGFSVDHGEVCGMLGPNGTAAAGSAVALGVTTQILNEIQSLGSIREVLPLRYFDAWTGLFWSDRVPNDVYSGLLLPIPYVVIFGAVAWWWFRRKDVLS